MTRVDWRKLEVGHRELRFRESGIALTLNEIVQGYGADQARAASLQDVIVLCITKASAVVRSSGFPRTALRV